MADRIQILIIAGSCRELENAYQIYAQALLQNKTALIVTAEGVEACDKKYACRSLGYYQREFRLDFNVLRKESVSLVTSLSYAVVYPGTDLRTLCSYKGVSLWELCAQYLNAEIIPYLYYLEIAEKIVEFERPDEVYVSECGIDLKEAFSNACKKQGVSLRYLRVIAHKRVFTPAAETLKAGLLLIKKIKRFTQSLYYAGFNLFRSFSTQRSYEVVFFAPLERFLTSMLPVAQRYDGLRRLVVNTYPGSSAEKLKQNKVFYTEFYGYELYGLSGVSGNRLLKNIGGKLKNYRFFKQASYKGFLLEGLFLRILPRMVCDWFPQKMRFIRITEKIIRKYKPMTVVVSNTAYDLAIIAKSFSVSVVSLQCAHPQEYTYFSKVISDAITVEGSFWKDFLIAHNVLPEKIWVCGAPKFDSRLSLERPAQKADAGLGLLAKKKIVVFAASYSSLAMGTTEYEKIEKLKNVCRAIKGIEQVHLLIKLHPFDCAGKFYGEIAQGYGLTDFSIVKDTPMLEVLDNCDLLITYHSVAGYEAVLKDKNVLWLTPAGDFRADDVWDFRSSQSVAIVEDFKDLHAAICDVLFNPAAQEALKNNRKAYIESHVYNLDGQAASRVKAVIDSFCRRQAREPKEEHDLCRVNP